MFIRTSCIVLGLLAYSHPLMAADVVIIDRYNREVIPPRRPLPQEDLQRSRELKALQQQNYNQTERELIQSHTTATKPLTQEDVEAIVDKKLGRKGKKSQETTDEKPAEKTSADSNFGAVGGLGNVGGIGAVGTAASNAE